MPLTLGVGVLGLGVVKRSEERRELRAITLREEAEIAPHVDRVRDALREPKTEQTVEWLAAKLRLPETTVVRVLDRLRKQGDIEEELNVENGEWYYFATRELGAVRGDLESRMAALKKGRTE
jgi:DNA-binding MarR family transcriptional regulator